MSNRASRIIALSFLTLFCLVLSANVSALALNMVRIEQPFPETLDLLKKQIHAMGYTVSRIQKVDYGLSKMGFKTDSYQIVFFGKYDEVNYLTDKYPGLIPFLPLKIVIFAEGLDTLLLSNNYYNLSEDFSSAELTSQFQKWRQDTAEIFSRVQKQQE